MTHLFIEAGHTQSDWTEVVKICSILVHVLIPLVRAVAPRSFQGAVAHKTVLFDCLLPDSFVLTQHIGAPVCAQEYSGSNPVATVLG